MEKIEKYYPKTVGELREVMSDLSDDYPIGHEDSQGIPIRGIGLEKEGKFFHEINSVNKRLIFYMR